MNVRCSYANGHIKHYWRFQPAQRLTVGIFMLNKLRYLRSLTLHIFMLHSYKCLETNISSPIPETYEIIHSLRIFTLRKKTRLLTFALAILVLKTFKTSQSYILFLFNHIQSLILAILNLNSFKNFQSLTLAILMLST